MRIEFEIKGKNRKELSLAPSFCQYVADSISKDILDSIVEQKLELREKDFLEATFIDWIQKPKSINISMIVREIARQITFISRVRSQYVILINPHIKLRNTRTSLEKIARYIDKGNEKIPGTFFIGKIFMAYKERIAEYWSAYVYLKLKKANATKVQIIFQ